MKITEVRIFPTESKDGKLKAFATMTFDDWFVVRNVKVIQGNNGPFVAMPSRKAMDPCPKCCFKNVVGSRFCNQCGSQLSQQHVSDDQGNERHGNHMDIAHPITQECRVYIQERIIEAYSKDIAQAGQERAAGERDRLRHSEVLSLGEDRASDGGSEPGQDRKIETVEVEDAKDIEL